VNKEILYDLLERPATTLGHLLGLTKLTDLHNKWITEAWDSDKPQAMLAFRGSYKTTAVVILGIIRYLILFPKKRILLIRKTQKGDASPTLQTISRMLEMDGVKWFYEGITGQSVFKIIKNTATQVRLSTLPLWYKEASISVYGINDSITGNHGDVIVTDDILNIQDRVSAAARQQTLNRFYELQNVIENTGDVKLIYNGTRWHKDDIWQTIENIGAEFHEYPASKYWELLFPKEQLDIKYRSMTPALYAINYELSYATDDSLLFQNPNMDGKMNTEGWRQGEWCYIHIDAAYGGKDFSALTLAQGNNRLGLIWQEHIQRHIPEIVRLYRQYKCRGIICETNADKGYVAEELKKYNLSVISYSEKENKQIKIANYLLRSWNKLHWCPETSPEYMSQILDWTDDSNGHDDAPDSASSLQRYLDNRRAPEMPKMTEE
jgi:hypothetical protein